MSKGEEVVTQEVGHCKECNGTEVQFRVWKNPNTGDIEGDEHDDEDTWCNDCQEHTGIKYTQDPI